MRPLSLTRALLPAAALALASLAGCAADDMSYAAGDQSWNPPPAPGPAADQPGPVEGQFAEVPENDWIDAAEESTSTFSVDTDTASYTVARRSLMYGARPIPASVRVEEFLNFFRYDYAAPDPRDEVPFALHLEGAPSPFGEQAHLLRVAVKGKDVPVEQRSPANLVFLVDVSGSMHAADKLDLVKFSLERLLDGLQEDDTVAIVTYAGANQVLLEPTPVARRAEIREVIAGFTAGGGTNGAAGIRTAYDLAEQAFRQDGVNRVVLCTDGDFNVGLTGEPLIQEVERWRDRSIFLTVLGYGTGNLNDAFIEDLTNRADGQYAYVDSRNEALRVLGDALVGTLEVIAKDVKIQVQFDPEAVRRYRLIGYDNRVLANDDFRDDTVDAGEIGSGHAVTALYEVELTDAARPPAEVRVRYKRPEGGESSEVSTRIEAGDIAATFDEASADFRFATAVAELAEILRESKHSVGERLGDVEGIIRSTDVAPGSDRAELLDLIGRIR